MRNLKKATISLLLVAVLSGLVVPQPTEARNLFRQFFRDLRRGTRFIVKLPDRATRWMGPVLGPIASAMITQNIAGHHKFGQLFTKVRRVNNIMEDIEAQKQLTGEVRDLYREQANSIRDHVKKLEAAREELREQLLSRDVKWDDYKTTAIELDNMIKTYSGTADRFENSANNLRTQDIIKMAGNQLLGEVLGEVKNAVINEVSGELESLIHPGILAVLATQQSGGIDSLIDVLVSGDIDDILNGGNYDGKFDVDELKERVRDRIKEILQENKDALKDNMQEKIRDIIQDMIENINEEKSDIDSSTDEALDSVKNPPQEEEKKNPYNEDELAASLSDVPKDEFGCGPGYIWKRMSGVGCVQEDCAAAGGHYSYTQACICGFVDSKPGDKTKACMRPANYLACPSCLYACVAPDTDCPER